MNFLPLDTTQSKRSPVRRITAPKTAKTGTRNNYYKSLKSNKNPRSTNDSNYFNNSIHNEEINSNNNETRSIYSSHTSTQNAPISSNQENDQDKEELISYWTEKAVVHNSDLSNPKISSKIKPEILPDLIKNLQSVRDACIIEGRAELSRRADSAITACKNLYKENLINETSNNQSQNIQKRIDQAREELRELQERITVQEANMANEFQEQNRKLKEKHKNEIKLLQNEWYVEDTKIQEPNGDDESYLDNNYYDSMYPTAVNKNFKSAKNSDKYSIFGDDDDEDIFANKYKKSNYNYDDYFDNEYMDDFVKKSLNDPSTNNKHKYDDNHTNKNTNQENEDHDNSTKNESNIMTYKHHKKIKKKKSKKTNSEMKNRENNELNNAVNNFANNLLETNNEDDQSVNSETADDNHLENEKSDDSQIEDNDSKTSKNNLSSKVSNAFIKLNKDDDEIESNNESNIDDDDDKSENKGIKSDDESNNDIDDDKSENKEIKSDDESNNDIDDYSKATDEGDLKAENKKSDDSQDDNDDDINEASNNDLSGKINNAFMNLNKDESENREDDKNSNIDDIDSEQSENKSISNKSDVSDHSNEDDDSQSEVRSDSEIMNDESSIHNSESQNVDEHSRSYNDEVSHEGNSTIHGDEKDSEIENEISDVHSTKQSISTNKKDESDTKSKNSNSIKNDKIFKRFFSDAYEPNLKSNSKKEINVDDSLNIPKIKDNYSIESASLNSNYVNDETESKNNQANSSSKLSQTNDKKQKQKRNMTDTEIISAPITHVVNRSQLKNRADIKSSNYKKEKRLRQYNKTSSELRNLRRQAAFLLSENKVDEARLVQQRADAIEKEEILSSSLQMRQDYEKSLESLIKKQEEEEENLKKLQNIKRTKYENAKQEGIGILKRRIEKLENEMKKASNKDRANALFQRSSNLQKSSLGSRSKLKNNRNHFTSEEKMANIKESEEENFYDDHDQQFNRHNKNHQSHEMNDFSYESNDDPNSIENQKLDMSHSLNRNAKRKPIDRSGLNRYNFYTFASKINKSASQNLNQNLNQSLKEQIDLNVNKSLDLMNQRHPLAKRRKIPTAVSMPLTSRRQVKPGEFSRLELPPLNASKEAKKIIKSAEKSMRLNKDYI